MTDSEEEFEVAKFRSFKITYYSEHASSPDGTYGSFEIEAVRLPNHTEIMGLLNQEMPERPRGGWYEMESQ